MEKIQSAIARAREERARRLGTAPEVPAAPAAPATAGAGAAALPPPSTMQPGPVRQAAAPDPAPAAPAAEPPGRSAAADAAWLALAPLRVDPRRLARARITSFEGGPDAAPYDLIRTRLLQQCRTNGWRRIGITSPGKACGKSTLALNLAFSLARQRDTRAILIEADLRRPSLARMLGLRDPANVARVLEGAEPFSRHGLVHGGNLAIATAQGPVRNAAELLHGPNVDAALRAIEAVYAPAVILFDLPPLFAADDVLAVAPHLDAVLIVAAAERTTIDEVDAAERDLAAHTTVMGVVLNKCRYASRNYGYDYY